MTLHIQIDVAPGELIDKLTILEIKLLHITEPEKRHHVDHEYQVLDQIRRAAIPGSTDLDDLVVELKTVNEQLWRIEDAIRDCEREGDFGPRFIDLARSVYRTNDRRAAIKRAINDLLGSDLVEEKSYAAY